jgi:uncharacterized cupredoxin-like copper-binding protein
MQHKQHNRICTYVASAVTVATLAIAAALIAVGAPSASAVAAPRVINVSGIITAFTPKTINVAAGEQVSICLTSPDTDHDLTIATAGNFQVVAPHGTTAVCKTLTAPAKAGAYKFICSIPGHESAGMVGSLVVAAAGEAVPSAPAAPGAGAAQAGQVPAGGVQADVRPLVDLSQVTPLMLGAALLVAAMMCALLGWVVARKN